MRFGLFTHLPWPENTVPRRLIDEITEQVQYGEALGFQGAWFAEHHFSRYGLGSSSLVLLGALAAQTKTIRLGTAVLVPTLHNPIRLAEDIAMVDVISNGRIDVGFGRGSAGYEYNGYGLDRNESQQRFQESIRMILGLWTTPEYSQQGQFHTINQATLVPPVVQQPHPPVYIAATRTPATLEFVVSTGQPLLVGMVLDTVDALDLCHRFVRLSAAAGYHIPMSRIPFLRYFYVAETDEQALEDTRQSLEWTIDMIQWRGTFRSGSEVHHRLDDWRRQRTELPTSFAHLAQHRAIFGSPETCVAQIKALQQEGIAYFGCNFAFGGMAHHKVMRSMQLFAEAVMPHFRA
jgi:alkanesulfonate monooxygenase SsuD/methylene tetrahydromethanopterin reductase-like flavin-dependent oxidoreductase (luciferase family)